MECSLHFEKNTNCYISIKVVVDNQQYRRVFCFGTLSSIASEMWLNVLMNDHQLQTHDKIGKEKTHSIFQPKKLILTTYAKDFSIEK
jgi:hypothetical protein